MIESTKMIELFPWEYKVWGRVKHNETEKVMTSILEIDPNFRCSIHHHEHRFNQFHVITGSLTIVCYVKNDRYFKTLKLGDVYVVPPNIQHYFECREPSVVVETYWTEDGTPVSINDIVRFDEGGPIDP